MKYHHKHYDVNIQIGNLSAEQFRNIAEPIMLDISKEFEESVSVLAFLDNQLVYVARIQTEHILTTDLSIGATLPVLPTSAGRVLLSGLSTKSLDDYLDSTEIVTYTERTITDKQQIGTLIASVAKLGYSYTSEELNDGIHSIAVPVNNREGKVVAALTVHALVNRLDGKDMKEKCLPSLLQASKLISEQL